MRFAGCVSDQPDDAPDPLWPGWNGDGSTREDCVIGDEGMSLCARAERCAAGPRAAAGRRYAVTMVGIDDCGNRSAPVTVGSLHVPHDRSDAPFECVGSATAPPPEQAK